MVKPNQTPATEDKNVADKIMNNQQDIHDIYKKVDYDKDFWCKYYALNDKPYGEYPKISADKNIKTEIHSDTVEKSDDKIDISEV